MLISVDFCKSMYGYAMESQTRAILPANRNHLKFRPILTIMCPSRLENKTKISCVDTVHSINVSSG